MLHLIWIKKNVDFALIFGTFKEHQKPNFWGEIWPLFLICIFLIYIIKLFAENSIEFRQVWKVCKVCKNVIKEAAKLTSIANSISVLDLKEI